MKVDYRAIGERVSRRRRQLRLTQAKVAEMCDISDQYLSNIERAVSIPSTEVVMRLAAALDTTPDEFLVGALHTQGDEWRTTAQRLRALSPRQLALTNHFLDWVSQEPL